MKSQTSQKKNCYYQKIDFFNINPPAEHLISKYSHFQTYTQCKEVPQIYHYLNVKIYLLKQSKNYQQLKLKNASPILNQQYIKLINQQFKEPRKIKGIRQILRRSILQQLYNEIRQITNKCLKLNLKKMGKKIVNEPLLCQLLHLMNFLSNLIFQTNQQRYNNLRQLQNDVIKNLQENVNKIIIKDIRQVGDKLIIFSIQIKILHMKLINNLKKQNLIQLILKWNEGWTEFKTITAVHSQFFQLIQQTLKILKNKFVTIKQNSRDIQIFNTNIRNIFAIFNQNNYSWNLYKAHRFILYCYSQINPHNIDLKSKIPNEKLIQHLKSELRQRILLNCHIKIEIVLQNCFQFLSKNQLLDQNDKNKQFFKLYNQSKKNIIINLNQLVYKYQKIKNFEGQIIWEVQKYLTTNLDFSKIGFVDVNYEIVSQLINKILQKKGLQQYYANIKQRFKYFMFFINQKNLIDLNQTQPQKYIKNRFEQRNLTFTQKIPYLLLSAIHFQNFQNQIQKYINVNNLQNNYKQILKKISLFSETLKTNIQQTNQILTLFRSHKFTQGWLQFKQVSKKFKKRPQSLQPYYKIQQLYDQIKAQSQIFDYFDVQKIQAEFKKHYFHKDIGDEFEFIKQLIVILNFVSQDEISLKRKQSKALKDNLIKISNQQIGKYIKHYRYINQQQIYHKYVIKLSQHPILKQSSKQIIQKIKNKLQNIRLAKCFNDEHKIVSINISRSEIVIKLKQVKQQRYRELPKVMKTLIRKYKRMVEQQCLQKQFPYWYCYFNKDTLKIQKKSNTKQFQITINPYQSFFISLFMKKQNLQKKLQNSYPNYPFIHLAQIIQKQKQNSWFQYQQPQFSHLLKQLKALCIQKKQNFINQVIKLMNDSPYLWGEQRKMVQIINFHQKYKNQIYMQQIRRKNNQENYQRLKILLSQKQQQIKKYELQKPPNYKKNICLINQKIKKIKKRIKQHNPIYGRKIKKQTKINSSNSLNQQKQQDQIDLIKPYQPAQTHNLATQGFYSIEGVIQKAAFQQNIHNYNGTIRHFRQKSDDIYQRYQYVQGKDLIRDIIYQTAKRQQRKLMAKNKQLKKDPFHKITYRSFQFHLRNMRNMCAHYVYLDRKQIPYNQKIVIIQKNYPKFFIFLYQWKQILGKPISYDFDNQRIQSQRIIQINQQFKQQQSQQKDIIAWVNIALSPLFNKRYLSEQNRKKRVLKLKQILPKYNNINLQRLFPEYEKINKKFIYCETCYYLGNSFDKQCPPWSNPFWELLNSLQAYEDLSKKQKHYNLLIMCHQNQPKQNSRFKTSDQKFVCFWANYQATKKAYINTLKRQKYQNQQIQYMQNLQIKKIYQNQQVQSMQNLQIKCQKFQFEEIKQDDLQEIFLRTDYLGNMFLFQLLGQCPQLLNDIRHTRHLWDQTIKSSISFKRQW